MNTWKLSDKTNIFTMNYENNRKHKYILSIRKLKQDYLALLSTSIFLPKACSKSSNVPTIKF